MNTPDRAVARQQRRTANSPYARSSSKRKGGGEAEVVAQLPSLASSSSFRNLYNFVSSPFRSRAAPAAPARPVEDESESESSDDQDATDGDRQPIELSSDSDDNMDDNRPTSEWKGNGKPVDLAGGGALTRSTATSNLSSLPSSNPPPPPPPSSSTWTSALLPSQTHAHALVQMDPKQTSQPRYAKPNPIMAPPPPPPPRAQAGPSSTLARSQTMSSLPVGGHTEAHKILQRFLAAKGKGGVYSEKDMREYADLVNKASDADRPPPRASYTPSLFHPGTAPTRLAMSTSTNTLANSSDSLSRSTSLSFLSPSRARPSSSSGPSASSSSRQVSSPARRRQIYLGPGMANTPKKKTVSFGGLDLPSPSLDSPGKKRRVEESGDDDEMDIERELNGLSSSRSVPSLSTQASSSTAPSASGSPFTFAIPFSPTTSSSNSYPQQQPQAPPSPSPASARVSVPIPAPAAPAPIKPSQSLSSGLSRYARHPSLVAPSPLRQSTKFAADSPESVKSNGGSPAPAAASPLGAKSLSAPAGVGGGKATKAGSMMLDLIQEEEVAKRAASPTPLQNPYQSALASPSPRRNPRRSIAAESRSSRAGSPASKRKEAKAPTALELIEKEAERDALASPTPASKKQKSLPNGSNRSTPHSSHTPSTPSPFSSNSPAAAPASTTPTSKPTSTKKTSADPAAMDVTPSWMTAVEPQEVVFAHDAFGGPIFGSSANKTAEADSEATDMDVSPAKATLELFKSGRESRKVTIEEKQFGDKPAFTFSSTGTSSPSAKASPSLTTPSRQNGSSASKDPKAIALGTDPLLLPNFTFVFSSVATPLPTSALQSAAINEVSKLAKASLPTFDLLAPPPQPVASTSGGFNWASAGMAPPPKPAADIWLCDICGTKSPLSASKCIACEEPRPTAKAPKAAPAPTFSAPVQAFNWASAGMAPPPKPSADVWTCDVCSTKSPLDAVKCIACEGPRPVSKAPTPPAASASAPAPAVQAFNWASAGMAPPPKPSADVWTCDICSTKSPLAKDVCIACEEPRPAGARAPAAEVKAVAAGGGGGFNWGAAGMKKPDAKSGWECGVCMVRNGDERTKCQSCETDKP